MFFGTNDCWNAKPTQKILGAYTFVLNKIRKINPRVHLLVASITSLEPTQFNCPTCPANVKELNGEFHMFKLIGVKVSVDNWETSHEDDRYRCPARRSSSSSRRVLSDLPTANTFYSTAGRMRPFHSVFRYSRNPAGEFENVRTIILFRGQP
jgi:hypothetical protein